MPLQKERFSVDHCRELTQLIYHKCRYEQFSQAHPALADSRAESIYEPSLEANGLWVSQPGEKSFFLGTLWDTWRRMDWTPLICCPAYLEEQYEPDFLEELCAFLREESSGGRDCILQSLYFALCTSYGFFFQDRPAPGKIPPAAQHLEEILRASPRHQEYLQDLHNWEELKEMRRLALFSQKCFDFSRAFPGFEEAGTHGLPEEWRRFGDTFGDTARELLLSGPSFQKEWIAHSLTLLPGALFTETLPRRIRQFQQLMRIQQDFVRSFRSLHDYSNAENDYHKSGNGYIPLRKRLWELRYQYDLEEGLEQIVCSPFFIEEFRRWLHPSRSETALDPRMLEYDFWRELRRLFEEPSPSREKGLCILTTDAYFAEYEKRYQRELLWQAQKAEESYLEELLPIPPLNPGKVELLRTVEEGREVPLEELPSLFGGLYRFDEDALRFFSRLTSAMAHFRFLLITPRYEKDPVPEDAVCFLRDRVILYRGKEQLRCTLRLDEFYDMLSRIIDRAALQPLFRKPSFYSEAFLDGPCRNLYCFRYYIERTQD